MPTISRNLLQLRAQIASDLDDYIAGTASGGSTTTLTDTGEITRYPDGYLRGAEVSTTSGTGSGQSNTITNHATSGGTTTLTVPSWTAVGNDTVYEIHRIGGRGYTKKQYDDAIFQAIDLLADYEWTDLDTVALAIERGSGSPNSVTIGTMRREYPLPSGFNGIFAVDVLASRPVALWGTGGLKTWRALGDATARTRLAQGFQVQQDVLVEYIAVYLRKAGSPTDNLTCVVETDSSSLPSGSAVTDGTSGTIAASTLSTRGRYAVFNFTPPMLLSENTQYHLTLRRSDAVDGSNYYQVGEDDAGAYGHGTLATYNNSAWSAVSGSDLVFAVSPAGAAWATLAKTFWDYRPASTDQLLIRRPDRWYDGTPIRIRGGAAIARPSTETTEVPVRPEWVATCAKAILKNNRAGVASVDNHGRAAQSFFAQLGIQTPPRRPFPANWTRVTG
ncbi:MAG: hypothetical protein IT318_20380 [Anaerolineales bacterium]|nr:hypothetical protein [Anaerolineales bacterium]